MDYPDKWYEDSEGFKWFWDEDHDGYTLYSREDYPCYQGLPRNKVEREFGLLHPCRKPRFLR